MTQLCIHWQLPEDTRVTCGNCDWAGLVTQLEDIHDAQERLCPGEETPAGECPICGALAYIESEIDNGARQEPKPVALSAYSACPLAGRDRPD